MNRLERNGAAGHEVILNEIENLVDGLTRNVIVSSRKARLLATNWLVFKLTMVKKWFEMFGTINVFYSPT